MWRYASQGCVECQLTHRYPHTLGTKVTKTKDPLTICHNYCSHIHLWPVLDHIIHMALVMDADKQALRSLESKSKLLTSKPYSWSVYYRHQLHGVFRQQLVEELLIPV